MSKIVQRVKWFRLPDAPLQPDNVPETVAFYSREGQIVVWNLGLNSWRYYDTAAQSWSAPGTFPGSFTGGIRPGPVNDGLSGYYASPGIGPPMRFTSLAAGGPHVTWPADIAGFVFQQSGLFTQPSFSVPGPAGNLYPWTNAASPEHLWVPQENGAGQQGLIMGLNLENGTLDRAVITDMSDLQTNYSQGQQNQAFMGQVQRFDTPANPYQFNAWDFYFFDPVYNFPQLVNIGAGNTPPAITVQCAGNAIIGGTLTTPFVPAVNPEFGSAAVNMFPVTGAQAGLMDIVEVGIANGFGAMDDFAALIFTSINDPASLTWIPVVNGAPSLPITIGAPSPFTGGDLGGFGLIGGVPYAIDEAGHFFVLAIDTVEFVPYQLRNWTWPLRLRRIS